MCCDVVCCVVLCCAVLLLCGLTELPQRLPTSTFNLLSCRLPTNQCSSLEQFFNNLIQFFNKSTPSDSLWNPLSMESTHYGFHSPLSMESILHSLWNPLSMESTLYGIHSPISMESILQSLWNPLSMESNLYGIHSRSRANPSPSLKTNSQTQCCSLLSRSRPPL